MHMQLLVAGPSLRSAELTNYMPTVAVNEALFWAPAGFTWIFMDPVCPYICASGPSEHLQPQQPGAICCTHESRNHARAGALPYIGEFKGEIIEAEKLRKILPAELRTAYTMTYALLLCARLGATCIHVRGCSWNGTGHATGRDDQASEAEMWQVGEHPETDSWLRLKHGLQLEPGGHLTRWHRERAEVEIAAAWMEEHLGIVTKGLPPMEAPA